MTSDQIAAVNAALTRGDDESQARVELAKHCTTTAELDRAMAIWSIWVRIGGAR